MNTNYFTLLLIFFCWTFCLNAQTVIGENFQLNDPDQQHILLTHSGDQLLGKVVYIEGDSIGFQIRNINEIIHFSIQEISFIGDSKNVKLQVAEQREIVAANNDEPYYRRKRNNGKSFPMPTNNLFYSATALNHDAKGTFRNTLLLYNYFERQFTPNITVGAGGFLPGFISVKGQVKTSLSDFVHIGAAFQVFQILVDDQRSTHPYAMVTIGDNKKYLNFTYGYWFDRFGFNDSNDNYQMVTAGGSYAFTENWRFYAEVVAVYDSFNNSVFPSFSFSNHRRRNTYEFGLLAMPTSDFPLLPLFTYYLSF